MSWLQTFRGSILVPHVLLLLGCCLPSLVVIWGWLLGLGGVRCLRILALRNLLFWEARLAMSQMGDDVELVEGWHSAANSPALCGCCLLHPNVAPNLTAGRSSELPWRLWSLVACVFGLRRSSCSGCLLLISAGGKRQLLATVASRGWIGIALGVEWADKFAGLCTLGRGWSITHHLGNGTM